MDMDAAMKALGLNATTTSSSAATAASAASVTPRPRVSKADPTDQPPPRVSKADPAAAMAKEGADVAKILLDKTGGLLAKNMGIRSSDVLL